MDSRFLGRKVLVTGSTTGIGFATAEALLRESASVVVHGQRKFSELPKATQDLLEQSENAHYLMAELSDPTAVKNLVEQAREKLQGLDGLVLNAAVAFHKNWLEITAADWDRVMDINLRANLLLAQAAAPYLIQNQGSIVAVSSTNAFRVNKKNLVYDSAKAALNHMFRAIALELRDQMVRVNIVMPGGVETPMLEHWLKDYAGSESAAKKALNDAKASGMLGKPDGIAAAILFLLSNEARWVNGTTLVVDGGAHLDS